MVVFIKVMPLLVGVYMLLNMSFTEASGGLNKFLFKFVPLILGIASIFAGLKLIGWIN